MSNISATAGQILLKFQTKANGTTPNCTNEDGLNTKNMSAKTVQILLKYVYFKLRQY
jgi:hypothetical protein